MPVAPPSVLTGMSQPQLQAALAAAQAAYVQLMTGSKLAVASYAQGDGSKSVTYARADLGQLNQFISQLQAALGLRPRRRGISFRF